MPTYSYRCTECGTAFDIQQSFTDDALTECPSCGGRLRKVFSPVGIAFKGSGFYRTDSQGAAAKKAPAASGSDSASSSSGSSDSGSSAPSSANSGSSAPAASPAASS